MFQFANRTLFIALLLLCSMRLSANTFTFNLNETDIKSVITSVSEMTGKNFIVDPRVKGKVTVISPKQMNADQIYQVFLSILNVHGFAAIPGKNVIHIVPEANAKQAPIPTTRRNGETEDGQFVTRVVQVENVSAAQMVPILRPLLPQEAHLAAYPSSNMLIISDVAKNIERIIDLVKKIDVEADAEIEVVPVIHASAEEIASILSALQPKKAKTKAAEDMIKVLADVRTNSIILSGEKSARDEIRTIIKSLDTPVEGEGNTKVIYLKYANAKNVATVLGSVAKALVGNEDPNAQKKKTGMQYDIQADETTNALVISASPSIMDDLEDIIRQLDIRRAQVMVKAIIAEISKDKSAEFGVNWGYNGASIDNPVGLVEFNGAITGLYQAFAAQTAPPTLNGLSLGLGKVSGSTGYVALLRALKGDADSNILSTPSLVTLDNESAEIVVGQNVPFVTGSYTSTGTGNSATNPFQTIQREDVGLSLKIKPQINEGNSIRLEIEQEVSSLSAASSGASDVITNKRSLKTTVMVDDGQILALGGLIDETLIESAQKVPGLGDIPVLGWLFSQRSVSKMKRDLNIFLHPTIVRDSNQGMAISSRKYSALRAEQLKKRDTNHPWYMNEDAPVIPDLPDFLELPPTYEEYMENNGDPVATTVPAKQPVVVVAEPQTAVVTVTPVDTSFE